MCTINMKRIFKLKAILLLTALLLIGACEKEISWNFPDKETEKIVVQSVLTSEFKNQSVRLSRPAGDQNSDFEAISEAIIKVKSGNITYDFTESAEEKGLYTSTEAFAASINQEYDLEILIDTALYEATSGLTPVTAFASPGFNIADTNGRLTLSLNVGSYGESQAMYEIQIDWSELDYDSSLYEFDQALMYQYTFNTLDVNYIIFPPEKSQVYFPIGSSVTITKYSLTDDYAEYLRALVAETEWQGSLFEESRGNLPGNISNSGLGYFSASSVIRQEIIANPFK